MTELLAVIGPPGCGKTTELSKMVANAALRFDERDILVASLTKAAANTVAGRTMLEDWQVGTLHSVCFHALGRPHMIGKDELEEWNEDFPVWALTSSMLSKMRSADEKKELCDDLYHQADIRRAKAIPRVDWPQDMATAFYDEFDAWKRERDYHDFTDLIERAVRELQEAPNQAKHLFFDEAQDFSQLEVNLVRQWAESAEHCVCVGDPNQCQPPGTVVQTSNGPVAIEDLDPRCHTLLTFDRRKSVVLGKQKPFTFEIAACDYVGELYQIEAAGFKTKATVGHRWIAQWDRARDFYVVYLMYRQGRWRTGWCQLFGCTGSFHLKVRANLEKAEALWVLRTFEEKPDASAYENYVAVEYGIPMMTFDPRPGQHSPEPAWLLINTAAVDKRAKACLSDHGRERSLPLLTRDPCKHGTRHSLEVHSCNLMPEAMKIPIWEGTRKAHWESFSISKSSYKGKVYSLSVKPYETYIAGGIVTHNSIFSFRGASPEALAVTTKPRILSQSYRVPRLAWQAARRLFSEYEYEPRKDDDGNVVIGEYQPELPFTRQNVECVLRWICDELERHEGEVMVLATCSYMLWPLAKSLRDEGIPYHNPYSPAFNPLGSADKREYVRTTDRLMAFLERPWTARRLELWLGLTKGVLLRGSKPRLKQLAYDADVDEAIFRLFKDEAFDSLARCEGDLEQELDWLKERLNAAAKKACEFPLRVYERNGIVALKEPPRVVLSTIHGVKGGEADAVLVYPDLSNAGKEQYGQSGWDGKDAILRQFYVALTRTRHTLALTRPVNKVVREIGV